MYGTSARGVRLAGAALDEKLQAGHARHEVIGNDDGKRALLQDLEGSSGLGAGDDVVALAFKGFLECAEHARLVVDDQESVAGRYLGRGHGGCWRQRNGIEKAGVIRCRSTAQLKGLDSAS